MQARNQSTQEQLQIDERQEAERKCRKPSLAPWRSGHLLRVQIVECRPKDRAEQQDRDAQMRGKAIRRHRYAGLKAALNHPPADEALQSAEREEQHHARPILSCDGAGESEPQERHEEHETDSAAEETMRPFPPENSLERFQCHAGVFQAVLRDLLVFVEGVLPRGVVQRRDGADDGVPLRNRKSRAGEARQPADHHHRHDHHRDAQ